MAQEDFLIKDQPTMTPEQTSAMVIDLNARFSQFQQTYNSKNYGKKVREEGEVIMAKGRQLVGSRDDILILDGADPTYRMWAGAADPDQAPFRVTKEGLLMIGDNQITPEYNGVFLQASGTLESGWGSSSSWTAGTPGAGKITITHNLGTASYLVLVSVMHASAVKRITVTNRGTNSFTVYMANASEADEINDFAFKLIMKP